MVLRSSKPDDNAGHLIVSCCIERTELRAEIERLRAQADRTAESFAQRLTEADYRCAQAQDELERLRAALHEIADDTNRDWWSAGKARDALKRAT